MLLFHRSIKDPQREEIVEQFSLLSNCTPNLENEEYENVVDVEIYDILEACSSSTLVNYDFRKSEAKDNPIESTRFKTNWQSVPELSYKTFEGSHKPNAVVQFESSFNEQSYFVVYNNSLGAEKMIVC